LRIDTPGALFSKEWPACLLILPAILEPLVRLILRVE
jgi:hypothetical protein